jgi:hypothetical protein
MTERSTFTTGSAGVWCTIASRVAALAQGGGRLRWEGVARLADGGAACYGHHALTKNLPCLQVCQVYKFACG